MYKKKKYVWLRAFSAYLLICCAASSWMWEEKVECWSRITLEWTGLQSLVYIVYIDLIFFRDICLLCKVHNKFFYSFVLVLRIRDFLVRIQIRGSVPLTNGFGSWSFSGSCYFRQWPSRWQLKLLIKFFFTFWATFTSFYKDKKS